jgi:anti-anti-sigma regulatory factor
MRPRPSVQTKGNGGQIDGSFIDSLGLHTLLNVQRRLSRQSRSLAVICGEGPVRRAIELARLEDAFGVVSSLAEYKLSRAAP